MEEREKQGLANGSRNKRIEELLGDDHDAFNELNAPLLFSERQKRGILGEKKE